MSARQFSSAASASIVSDIIYDSTQRRSWALERVRQRSFFWTRTLHDRDAYRDPRAMPEKQFCLATEPPMRYPLDPKCPVVAEFMEALFGDPTMAVGAPVEDIH
jgi:hypothetical protein